MSAQTEQRSRSAASATLERHIEQRPARTSTKRKDNAESLVAPKSIPTFLPGTESFFLSQFLSKKPKWKSKHKQPTALRRMQSRNWLSIAFDNTLLALRYCFDKFADMVASVMAGILTPQQARSLSIYATAFLIALLMLVVCKELNMYCFRSVAQIDTAAAPRTNVDHSMLSNTQKESVL